MTVDDYLNEIIQKPEVFLYMKLIGVIVDYCPRGPASYKYAPGWWTVMLGGLSSFYMKFGEEFEDLLMMSGGEGSKPI